ncbi:MAG: DUF4214 domain-containing protein [Burkholderiales bacterium]|nr:DUF4214 domain-containing protein [Burkholderiales bacterium]
MRHISTLALLISLFTLLTACGGSANQAGEAAHQAPPTSLQASPPKFGGTRAGYTITKSATGFRVTDQGGFSVEVGNADAIQFDDMRINLRIGEKANSIAALDLRALIDLYVAFFNRVPDADGLGYWIDQFKAGMSLDQIAQSFYSAALLYSAQTGYDATMSNADFVKLIYKNVLGRSGATAPPDADVQYWANELKNGRSKSNLIGVMLTAARSFTNDPTWGWVPQLLDNKVAVANYFAVQQGINYNSPEESILNTIAIVKLISPTNIVSARSLIGVADSGFNLAGSANTGTATYVTLTLDVPELIKLSYKGSELKGKATVSIPKDSAPEFDVSVHPGFAWAESTEFVYTSGKISLAMPATADRTIAIATPKLSSPSSPVIYSASYDRSAIYRDEMGKTAMRVEVFAAMASNYKLILTYTGLDPVSKQDVTRDVPLLDDGVGADLRAGDFHFTASLTTTLLPRYEYMGIAAYEGRVHVVDAFGNEVGSAGQVKTGMSMVAVDRAKTVAVTKIADDVYASGSVVNVVVPGDSLRFNPDFITSSASADAMRRVLAFYPDVFDHASFFYAGNVGSYANNEYSIRLKNNVSGIGDYSRALSNNPAKFGSNTLDSISELTGGTTGPYMHELTHRFGFYLNDARLPLTESDGCHCHFDMWNQVIWDPISAGGGEGIVKTSDGNWTFASYQGDMQYKHSDMMLYLMGLIAPSELPPQPWVIDASGKLPKGQTIPASKVKLVTAADIEAIYGQRSPAYGLAPKTFRDAIILITAGRPALPEEMTAVELQAKFYASQGTKSPNIANAGWQNGLAYFDSTKGRGTLITELPARK